MGEATGERTKENTVRTKINRKQRRPPNLGPDALHTKTKISTMGNMSGGKINSSEAVTNHCSPGRARERDRSMGNWSTAKAAHKTNHGRPKQFEGSDLPKSE
jgi:hypothetical protein